MSGLFFRIESPSLPKFQERFHRAPDYIAEELELALEKSTDLIIRSILRRAPKSFRRGGIKTRPFRDVGSRRTSSIEIYGDLHKFPHMLWQEEGTSVRGIHKRPQYDIFPVRRRNLKYFWQGKVWIRPSVIGHPGIYPKLFFRNGVEESTRTVRYIIAGHLGNVTRYLRNG